MLLFCKWENTHVAWTFSQSGTVIEEVTWIKKSGTNRGKLERIHFYIFSYHGRVPWSTSSCWTKFGPPNLDDELEEHWCFFKCLLRFFGSNHVHLWFFVGKGIKNLKKPRGKTPESHSDLYQSFKKTQVSGNDSQLSSCKLPSCELMYPIARHSWRWFPFLQVGDFSSLEGKLLKHSDTHPWISTKWIATPLMEMSIWITPFDLTLQMIHTRSST